MARRAWAAICRMAPCAAMAVNNENNIEPEIDAANSRGEEMLVYRKISVIKY